MHRIGGNASVGEWKPTSQMLDGGSCWGARFSLQLLSSLRRGTEARYCSVPRLVAWRGALGLAFALKFPGNPARAGYVFVKLSKQLSPYEQELRGEMMGRRSPHLIVLLVAPYLLALASFGVWGMYTGPSIDLGSQVLSAFISAVQATSMIRAIQYLQVLRALRGADRDRASE